MAFVLVAAFSICPTVGQAQQKSGQGNQSVASKWLINQAVKRFDKDKDGIIQKSEVTGLLKQNFDRFDKNSNDKLDQNELAELAKVLGNLRNKDRERARQNRKPVPDSLIRETDIAYREGDSEKWKLDIVYPKEESDTPRPAIVFIHGGGWSSGDKAIGIFDRLPVTYAQKGYVCISVNYRFLQECPMTGCIADCKNAVRWLRANAKKYNVDPKRIGAFGNSAGAHLVSMLGLAGADAKLEGDGPYQDYSSAVQAVCCAATPTNFPNWFGKEVNLEKVNPRLTSMFGKGDVKKVIDAAKQCSPITHVKPGGVPFLVVHGINDKTVPIFQGDSFVEAMKEAKIDVTYLRYKGSGHGVFGQNGKKNYPAMEEFFERTLKVQDKN